MQAELGCCGYQTSGVSSQTGTCGNRQEYTGNTLCYLLHVHARCTNNLYPLVILDHRIDVVFVEVVSKPFWKGLGEHRAILEGPRVAPHHSVVLGENKMGSIYSRWRSTTQSSWSTEPTWKGLGGAQSHPGGSWEHRAILEGPWVAPYHSVVTWKENKTIKFIPGAATPLTEPSWSTKPSWRAQG